MKDWTVVYVVWRDASHGLNEIGRNETGLAELHEVGFLWHEDAETITLTMERQDGAESTRLWLTIPKSCIIKLEMREVGKLFPTGAKRKRRSVIKSPESKPGAYVAHLNASETSEVREATGNVGENPE